MKPGRLARVAGPSANVCLFAVIRQPAQYREPMTEILPVQPADAKGRQLPIDFAPSEVRAHGLASAHSRPLVSDGRQSDGGFAPLRRVSPLEAWDYREVEFRTGRSWPVAAFDLDHTESRERVLFLAETAGDVPRPNWIVTRVSNGHAHVVYTLAVPVLRGSQAREKPLRALGRASEYLGSVLGADAGYRGVLSHNPVHPGYETAWLRREPFTLSELLAAVPRGWRRPRPASLTSAPGRNCALFDALMRFAGRPCNRETDLQAEAAALNAEFTAPLGRVEVGHIVKHVEGYRSKWIAEGRYYTDEERSEWHRRQQALGVRARRARNAERDASIVKDWLAGKSYRSIGRSYGIDPATALRIVRRDVPLLVN